MTYTYAELEVSEQVFDEIAGKLREAGYHHAFNEGAIDMHGIGLVKLAEPELVTVFDHPQLPFAHVNRGD